jgi:hypothetical protein
VLGNFMDLYIDNVLAIDGGEDPTEYTAAQRIQMFDATGTGDGHVQLQFLRTYQDGAIPEPSSALVLLALGGGAVLRRKTR